VRNPEWVQIKNDEISQVAGGKHPLNGLEPGGYRRPARVRLKRLLQVDPLVRVPACVSRRTVSPPPGT